jgi:Domain of unknown function (DUF5134)
MAGPFWLAGTFAAVMILVGAYSASRLAVSLRRGWATESDADALHAVMGAAMAGMLVPRLSALPSSVWVVIFAIAAAWFGWRAVRTRGFAAAGPLSRFPVPHLIESVAMLYMLLPAHGPLPTHGRAGMAAAGMGPSTGPAGSLPVLAVLLAMFMLGYIVWTTDRLTSLARARTATEGPGRNRDRGSPAAVPMAAPPGAAGDAPITRAAGTGRGDQAGRPALTPGLATCGRLAMSITMGYMLMVML